MINWQTSLFGGTGIIAAVFGIYSSIKNGTTIDPAQWAMIGGLVSTGIGLIRAKDKNVTGGSVSNVTGMTAVRAVSEVDKLPPSSIK